MTKNTLNQNAKLVQELADNIEPNFNFDSEPINRFEVMKMKKIALIKKKLSDFNLKKK